ncbi:hypothetical protein GCM10019017_21640 [Streptomyces showdoensis]
MTATASPASRAAEILSRPVALNGLTVPNRIVMAPMTRMFSPGGVPGEDVRSYYARRAAAGVGLIVTEGTYVGHDSAGQSDRVPRFHGEEQLAGWAKVAEDVHAAGGTIVPQLWHIGMVRQQGQAPYPDAPAMGPVRHPHRRTEGTGKEMTRSDLDDVIGAFAEAAAAAERIGFDGVELHGAHGYLIDQFLWAVDEPAHRRVRRRPRGPYEVRGRDRGRGPRVRLARLPGALPLLAVEAGRLRRPARRDPGGAGGDPDPAGRRRCRRVPRLHPPPLDPRVRRLGPHLAGWTQKLTGLPAITVGSVGLDGDFIHAFAGAGAPVQGIDELLDRLERDEFDMVAVGRALLQDPEWAAKVLAGRTDELKPYDAAAVKTLS